MSSELAAKAEILRQLHHGSRPLVLANAWDAVSAKVVEGAGFAAVATSSAALVRSLGWEDGGTAPVDEVFPAIARIARSVKVPVSADLEDGYRLEDGDLVARMLSAGAVGCNLEDANHQGGDPLVSAEAFAQRVASLKGAGRAARVDFVLNARTDVFLRNVGAAEQRLAEALRRGRLYLAAGADCIFVPARDLDEATIKSLVAGIGGPVNLLVGPEPGEVARAARLGAARISVGSGLARLVTDQLSRFVDELAGALD